MLTKTLLTATALVGVSAKNAAISNKAERVTSEGVAKAIDMSTIDTSAVITTGAWAKSWVTSCTSRAAEPWVDGYPLGECQQVSATSSRKYTGCEWITAGTSMSTYTSSFATADCTGTATTSTTPYTGLVDSCSDSSGIAYKYDCGTTVAVGDYNSPQHIGNYDTAACSGSEYWWEILSYATCTDDSSCIASTTYFSYKGICDDPDDTCFHVDTKIDYKGVEYTYDELKAGKEPECTVPHSPASKGVVISTSCDKTVRVTDTHLMATTKGFQLAYSLKAGDVLYGDYGKDMCTVKSVEKEKTTQQYFGLNCVHSEVLASGLRASTFGDFHTLPSWYMTYVGGLVGSETASSLGEYIAEWYFKK